MTCPNCSTEFENDMLYCPNCGTAVSSMNAQQSNDAQNNSQQNYYSQQGYTQQNYTQQNYSQQNYSQQNQYPNTNYNTGYNNTYSSQTYQPAPQPQSAPTVRQYVGWMLLGSLLGPVSIILSIIFACSSDNKPRADFFKAHLILMAITAVITFVVMIAMMVFSFSISDFVFDSAMSTDFMNIISLL